MKVKLTEEVCKARSQSRDEIKSGIEGGAIKGMIESPPARTIWIDDSEIPNNAPPANGQEVSELKKAQDALALKKVNLEILAVEYQYEDVPRMIEVYNRRQEIFGKATLTLQRRKEALDLREQDIITKEKNKDAELAEREKIKDAELADKEQESQKQCRANKKEAEIYYETRKAEAITLAATAQRLVDEEQLEMKQSCIKLDQVLSFYNDTIAPLRNNIKQMIEVLIRYANATPANNENQKALASYLSGKQNKLEQFYIKTAPITNEVLTDSSGNNVVLLADAFRDLFTVDKKENISQQDIKNKMSKLKGTQMYYRTEPPPELVFQEFTNLNK